MYYTGLDSVFWFKLAGLLISMILLFLVIDLVLKKLLKVDKKLFSYNHVNDLHKRIDWSIRITVMVAIIVSFFYGLYKFPTSINAAYMYLIISIIYLFLSELVRAFMEWKYLKGQKDYILTICELIFWIILIFIGWWTKLEFFGLFKF